jgi:Ser/Thr protein kinase RdoA (MazF antagonist)
MTDDEALAEARATLRHWGGAQDVPRLVKTRENIVFDVWLADGRHAALRLHRPGYQTTAAIRSELHLTRALAEMDVPVAVPVPTTDGALLAEGARVASCVGWLDGAPIGAAEHPFPGDPGAQAATMHTLGTLVARMHDAADAFAPPPGFERPAWDIDGLVGERPHWGRYWRNPSLTDAEARTLLAARDRARLLLEAYRADGADYGLIHADVLRENVLRTPDGLALIDFDDCGYGFRMLDLATAVSQGVGEPQLGLQVAALLAGYARTRPLPDQAESHVALFMTLRSFASAGWTISRFSADHPIQRRYAERAVWMAKRLLEGRLPWA